MAGLGPEQVRNELALSVPLLLALLPALLLALLPVVACGRQERPAPAYVGRAACAGCHKEQHQLWTGSHHDLAMQRATAETVLGNFEDATFEHHGVESRFFERDGEFFVRTDGPEGRLRDYKIEYTFGVEPLQQYLIAFPGGRLQALGICWDTRPGAQGGQRWFHLHPGERIDHDDELHWTGRRQNWNYTCAVCHSTNLQRNYDLATDSYSTTWSEIDVSCEACHGPGSEHVAWAETGGDSSDPDKGLSVTLQGPGAWSFEAGSATATAVRKPPLVSRREVETCARCHSRRNAIHGWHPGDPFLDAHAPELLNEPLYHADGQIRGEVYVYGSFLQSRMHGQGVTCSDCHEPHTARLRAPGNALCVRCHDAGSYDQKSHHFHEPGTAGASCVECHMPARRYMVVDPRHDHSFRVPRPDLSLELGTPNACTGCHEDKDSRWAAEAVAGWYPDSRHRRSLVDRKPAPIVRATALQRTSSRQDLAAGLRDPNPLVRFGALRGVGLLTPRERVALALPLAGDPVRINRMEAARILAPAIRNIPAGVRQRLEAAVREYAEAQMFNRDQPFAHMKLGVFYTDLGRLIDAEKAYRTAIRLAPRDARAYVNLADLYRLQGEDEKGEEVLQKGLSHNASSAHLHHALGLLLVRKKKHRDALRLLGRAADLSPGNPRYNYVFAVALHSVGQRDRAIGVLEEAHSRHPDHRELLVGLVKYLRERGDKERGDEERADAYLRKLRALR